MVGEFNIYHITHSESFENCTLPNLVQANKQLWQFQSESFKWLLLTNLILIQYALFHRHSFPLLLPVICVSMTADPDMSVLESSIDDAYWRHLSVLKDHFLLFFFFFSQDAAASYDFNDNDPDPFPRYDSTNENKWVICIRRYADITWPFLLSNSWFVYYRMYPHVV